MCKCNGKCKCKKTIIVDPHGFQTMPSIHPETEWYSRFYKTGEPVDNYLNTIQKLHEYVGLKVNQSPPQSTPTPTGNTSNLNEIIVDTLGDMYFIDILGNSTPLGSGGGGTPVNWSDKKVSFGRTSVGGLDYNSNLRYDYTSECLIVGDTPSTGGTTGSENQYKIQISDSNGKFFSVKNGSIDPWFHINSNGVGLVGDGTTFPFLSIEFDTAINKELRMHGSWAGDYSYLWAMAKPSYRNSLFLSANENIYIQSAKSNLSTQLNGSIYLQPDDGSVVKFTRWGVISDDCATGIDTNGTTGARLYQFDNTSTLRNLFMANGHSFVSGTMSVGRTTAATTFHVGGDLSVDTVANDNSSLKILGVNGSNKVIYRDFSTFATTYTAGTDISIVGNVINNTNPSKWSNGTLGTIYPTSQTRIGLGTTAADTSFHILVNTVNGLDSGMKFENLGATGSQKHMLLGQMGSSAHGFTPMINSGFIETYGDGGFSLSVPFGAFNILTTGSRTLRASLNATTGYLDLYSVPSAPSATDLLVKNGDTVSYRTVASLPFTNNTGTVTNFSANALSPLFTVNVTNPTTIPDLSFTLPTLAQKLVFASPWGTSGTPFWRQLQTSDLQQNGATLGQVVTWDGTAWTAQNPTGTIYTAGTGISVIGGVITNTRPSLWQRSGTVLSPFTAGDSVDLSRNSATNVVLLNMTNPDAGGAGMNTTYTGGGGVIIGFNKYQYSASLWTNTQYSYQKIIWQIGSTPTDQMSLTSSGLAINTIATGSTSVNILTSSGSGSGTVQSRTIASLNIPAASFDFKVQGGTTDATNSTQNVYRTGTVWLGNGAGGASGYQFRVTGDSYFEAQQYFAHAVYQVWRNAANNAWLNGIRYNTTNQLELGQATFDITLPGYLSTRKDIASFENFLHSNTTGKVESNSFEHVGKEIFYSSRIGSNTPVPATSAFTDLPPTASGEVGFKTFTSVSSFYRNLLAGASNAGWEIVLMVEIVPVVAAISTPDFSIRLTQGGVAVPGSTRSWSESGDRWYKEFTLPSVLLTLSTGELRLQLSSNLAVNVFNSYYYFKLTTFSGL